MTPHNIIRVAECLQYGEEALVMVESQTPDGEDWPLALETTNCEHLPRTRCQSPQRNVYIGSSELASTTAEPWRSERFRRVTILSAAPGRRDPVSRGLVNGAGW